MAYDYIEKYYGTRFKPGMRVKFTEDGRDGVVMRVRGDPQYVRVGFDGGRVGNCHPTSLAIYPTE